MRLKLIVALSMLILLSNCLASSFTPTSEDIAWAKAAAHDAKVLSSDMGLVSTAASETDYSSTKKYCDMLAEDAGIALQNSQRCTVSSDLQNAKDYYELALSSYQSGAEKVSSGCARMDASLVSEGIKLLGKGTEYMGLVMRELNMILE